MDVLVESAAGLEAALATGRAEGARWRSNSPLAMERMRASGLDAAWPEDLLPPGLPDRLGFAALDAANRLLPALERASEAAGIPSAEHAVLPLQRLLAALAYKEAVFEAWLAATPGPHLVVGEPRLSPTRGMDLDFYDTMFAVLADRRGVEILPLPVGDRAALRREIDQLTIHDRLLSFLDLGPAQVVHRWLLLARRGRVLGLPGGPLVRVLGDNDLVRELLPWVLARGGRLVNEPPVAPGETDAASLPGLPGAGEVADALAAACAGRGLDLRLEAAPVLAAERLAQASRWWRPAARAARERIGTWLAGGGPQALVANTISGPGGHFLAAEARQAGIPVIVAEHGVSAGLTCFHEPLRPYSEAKPCHIYLACSENTARFLDQEPGLAGRSLVVGLPARMRSVPLRGLQRLLTRRRLGAQIGRAHV